jgi:hypothetical protein
MPTVRMMASMVFPRGQGMALVALDEGNAQLGFEVLQGNPSRMACGMPDGLIFEAVPKEPT